ncbi:GntR family transcriptional regulator [Allopusillimonas soli]|nr:GntR family transcriptional regulator [Allopusillimonas soli]
MSIFRTLAIHDMTALRFTELAATLARRIADGDYPVGSFMPTEKALMHEFDTSRHTVRAAMQQLQDARLVSRRRGSGTIVEATASPPGFSQSLSSLEDLITLAASSPRRLLSVTEVVVDLELAAQLKVPAGSRWLRFSSTRPSPDGAPMVFTNVYVDVRYRDIRKKVRASPDELISALIEAHYGLRITCVKQDIGACLLQGKVAGILEAKDGSPGLFILRQYLDAAQKLVAVSTSHHPADRYQFSTTLVRQK